MTRSCVLAIVTARTCPPCIALKSSKLSKVIEECNIKGLVTPVHIEVTSPNANLLNTEIYPSQLKSLINVSGFPGFFVIPTSLWKKGDHELRYVKVECRKDGYLDDISSAVAELATASAYQAPEASTSTIRQRMIPTYVTSRRFLNSDEYTQSME